MDSGFEIREEWEVSAAPFLGKRLISWQGEIRDNGKGQRGELVWKGKTQKTGSATEISRSGRVGVGSVMLERCECIYTGALDAVSPLLFLSLFLHLAPWAPPKKIPMLDPPPAPVGISTPHGSALCSLFRCFCVVEPAGLGVVVLVPVPARVSHRCNPHALTFPLFSPA